MALTQILVVSDLERSRDWYRDVLGAEIYREYGGDSVVLSFLDNWILIVEGSGPTEDKPGVSMVAPSDHERVSHSATIRVPDCQVSYEVLRDRGAEFLTPPIDRGEEIRCFFRDPDGNLFEISQA
jgi:catechol 2,3-dioxygenase-like lactoylglutathione lyase family enzyme